MLKYFLIKMSSIFYYLRYFFGVCFFIFFTHRPLQLLFCSIRKKLFQLKLSQFVVAVFQSGNSRKTIEAIIAKRWKTDVRLKYANQASAVGIETIQRFGVFEMKPHRTSCSLLCNLVVPCCIGVLSEYLRVKYFRKSSHLVRQPDIV